MLLMQIPEADYPVFRDPTVQIPGKSYNSSFLDHFPIITLRLRWEQYI